MWASDNSRLGKDRNGDIFLRFWSNAAALCVLLLSLIPIQSIGLGPEILINRSPIMNQSSLRRLLCLAVLVLDLIAVPMSSIRADEPLPPLAEFTVTSTLDQQPQPVRIWVPEKASTEPVPLFIYLHSWSSDYKQDNSIWQAEAVRRGWIFLHPNFRGRNDHPEACGSPLARQDILDALDATQQKYRVDPERIYLAGTSGGGHMSMLMAGYHPHRFSAVSAWVGISDLTEWYRFHTRNGKPTNYATMMEAVCGGPAGKSAQIDAEYRSRSPLFVLDKAKDLPIDIAAGVEDGHLGSVPVRHSLQAFNVLARQHRSPEVSEKEMQQLWEWKKLRQPQPSDTAEDSTFGRSLHLRRTAGPSRVTIFAGDHEGLPAPACEWLSKQRRATRQK